MFIRSITHPPYSNTLPPQFITPHLIYSDPYMIFLVMTALLNKKKNEIKLQEIRDWCWTKAKKSIIFEWVQRQSYHCYILLIKWLSFWSRRQWLWSDYITKKTLITDCAPTHTTLFLLLLLQYLVGSVVDTVYDQTQSQERKDDEIKWHV